MRIPNYVEIGKEDSIYETIINYNPLPVRPATVENLDIVHSHILLADTAVELTTAIDHCEARLKNELEKVKATCQRTDDPSSRCRTTLCF